MKKVYKILFALLLLIVTKNSVKALTYRGCDYSTVAKLKSLINNINISYTYEIKNNTAYFDLTLNNVPKDVYFVDSKTRKEYTYEDTKNGEITIKGYNNVQDGQFRFYINNGICDETKLGSKYYKFPIYNYRYKSELCKDISNYSLCKKWISKEYTDYEFEQKILQYKEKLNTNEENETVTYEKDLITKIVDFYIKYYYYFLPLLIIVCMLIMYISKKKNSFRI